MIRTTILAAAAVLTLAAAPAQAKPAKQNAEGASFLLGVLAFSKANCPELRNNNMAFREWMRTFGYNPSKLPHSLDARALEHYAELEKGDRATVCRGMWGQLGPTGHEFPDLVLHN